AALNGFLMLFVGLVGLVGSILLFIFGVGPESPDMPNSWLMIALAIVLFLASFFTLIGLFAVQPNDARVLILFGNYIGSHRRSGCWWANPFACKKGVSLRVRTFSPGRVKVNDADGNPVEIAAVVVWHVSESAKATFDVDDFEEFVGIQAETALRSLATRYPYDSAGAERASLRENPDELAAALKIELEERLEVAGVDVLEARLTHL